MTPHISIIALWRSFRRVLWTLGLLLLIGVATGAAIVVQAGRNDNQSADAAIVMLDEGQGTPVRLDRARQLYADGRISRILLAGNNAESGRAALEARGIQEDALIDLNQPSQLEQLVAAKHALDQAHLRSVVLIAEPVETLRLLKIARDQDLRLLSTPTGVASDISITGIVREVVRYFQYVLLNK